VVEVDVARLHSWSWSLGTAASCLLHEDGAGVEQVKAAALYVLLRLGCGLGGDDREVAAGGRRVDEPGGEKGALDAPAAVRGRGRGACELSHAVGDTEAGAAGGDGVAYSEVAHDAGGCEVALGPLQDIAWKVLVRGHSLRVWVGEAVRDNV
jgi:hypothetical protein